MTQPPIRVVGGRIASTNDPKRKRKTAKCVRTPIPVQTPTPPPASDTAALEARIAALEAHVELLTPLKTGIITRALNIVDEEGRVRLVLAVNPVDGEPVIGLLGGDGQVSNVILTTGPAGGLALRDATGRVRVGISIDGRIALVDATGQTVSFGTAGE